MEAAVSVVRLTVFLLMHLRREQIVLMAAGFGAAVHQEHHNEELVNGLEHNLAHHRLGNDCALFGHTVALQFNLGGLS